MNQIDNTEMAGQKNRNKALNIFTHKNLIDDHSDDMLFSGPGLIDLQINGVQGIDFNVDSLNEEGLLFAAEYLLRNGVTTFFPTVITNSGENICRILNVIDSACRNRPLLNQCIGGIHLEGPFISGTDGYRGAHNKRYVRDPDWDLFCSFQKASGNRVSIITLAPELNNSVEFIRKCKDEGLIVGIAHSNADKGQIKAAVEAGASLSTHLGNSVPVMLPRHPNIIWDMLAEDGLYASIVADGYHLPDSFIKVVLKTKMDKAILVSDATYLSGMPPGVYESHIGEEVVLEDGGRLCIKDNKRLLAGATKTLNENLQYLVSKNLTDFSRAWYMASVGPAQLLGYKNCYSDSGRDCDMVIFNIADSKVAIQEIYKRGVSVWKSEV